MINDALNYPYKQENLTTVLTLAGIAAVLSSIPIIGIIASFLISGYGLRVLYTILAREDALPTFDYGTDITRGFLVALAGIVYMLIPIVLFVVGTILLGRSAIGLLMLFILMLPAIVLVSWALLIATIRFAITTESQVLWQIPDNFNTMWENRMPLLHLLGRQFIALLPYMIPLLVLNVIFGVMYPEAASLNFQPTLDYFIVQFIISVLSVGIGFISGITQYYLVAHFAEEIGFEAEKAKRKPKNDDHYSFEA